MKTANLCLGISLLALLGQPAWGATPSEIVVPISFRLDTLAALINERIPSGVVFDQPDIRVSNTTSYSYTIRRDAPVNVVGSGNELIFKVPLNIASAGTFRFCAGFWHDRECEPFGYESETGNVATSVMVELRVALTLDGDYRIRTQTSVKADLTGDSHLHLDLVGDLIRINIDIREQLERPLADVARQYQPRIAEKVTELTDSVRLGDLLQSAWTEIQKPIRIGDSRVLFKPEALLLGGLSIEGDIATILAGLRGTFIPTELDQAPVVEPLPAPTALPSVSPRFRLQVPLRLPYSALEDRIRLALDREDFGDPSPWIRYTEVHASGGLLPHPDAIQFTLGFEAELQGSAAARGELRFTGRAKLDPQTRLLRVENLELAADSAHELGSRGVSPASIEACTEKARRILDSAVGLKADEYIILLNPRLQNAEVGPLRLSGRLSRLQAYALEPGQKDFDLYVAAEGKLEVRAFLGSD